MPDTTRTRTRAREGPDGTADRPVPPTAAAVGLLTLLATALPGDGLRAQAGEEPAAAADSQRVAMAENGTAASSTHHRISAEGVTVELELLRSRRSEAPGEKIRSGDQMWIRMWLYDSETGDPLTGVKPGAWIDFRNRGREGAPRKTCRRRVQGYLPKKMRTRPAVDLNSYVVLGLNRGNHISVADPFFGFGSTRLITTVQLPGRGEDWVLGPARRLLYVTVPRRNLVAVVSTDTWNVLDRIPVGTRPGRIRFGPRDRLWVGIDGGRRSGLQVVDPRVREVVATLPTGSGHHEIAFTEDGRRLFVTNPGDGTVSVVDVADPKVVKTLRAGTRPADVATSAASGRAYVADAEGGTITIYDVETLEPTGRLTGSPGLWRVQFDPSGRWGFLLNRKTDEVHVLDARVDSVRHALISDEKPSEVAFTKNFAYVRFLGSPRIMMVSLRSLSPGTSGSAFARDYRGEKGGRVETRGGASAAMFPAGETAPSRYGEPTLASAITPAPHKNDGIYVANPPDESVFFYHYMEGMPTPAGNLKIPFSPTATLTVGRRLKESESTPGLYTASAEAPESGDYSFNLLIDAPRLVECFPFRIEEAMDEDEEERVASGDVEFRLQPVSGRRLRAGRQERVRFRVVEERSGEPRSGLEMAAQFTSPRGWITRKAVDAGDDGTYTATITAAEPGPLYLSVQIPEYEKGYRAVPPLRLFAEASGGEARETGAEDAGGGASTGGPEDGKR